MNKSKKILLLTVAVAGLFAGLTVKSAQAGMWYSNDFRSPTGNIRCHHNPATDAIACGTLNDGFTVALSAYGGKARKIIGGTVYRWSGGPVLGYGTFWSAHWLRCDSSYDRMTCRATQTGHGFWINRTSWNSW